MVTTSVMYWITTQEHGGYVTVEKKNYTGYPENVYDKLSHENEQNQGKEILWKDQIGLCQFYT